MTHLLTQISHPAVFAHRGASRFAPENTLAAFQLAVRQKADGIELDVKLSADQQLVVIHDQTVQRTTNGSGPVRAMPLAALRELDAGARFDPAFAGEKIPTLGEVFETVGRETLINIELTNYATPLDGLPELAANLVQHHGMQARVLFSSFNPIALFRIRRKLPETPVGLLTFAGRYGSLVRGLTRGWLSYQTLHPNAAEVTPALLQWAHNAGRRVYPYTVNDPDEMQKLGAWGVDGIFTDDPPLALKLFKPGR